MNNANFEIDIDGKIIGSDTNVVASPSPTASPSVTQIPVAVTEVSTDTNIDATYLDTWFINITDGISIIIIILSVILGIMISKLLNWWKW